MSTIDLNKYEPATDLHLRTRESWVMTRMRMNDSEAYVANLLGVDEDTFIVLEQGILDSVYPVGHDRPVPIPRRTMTTYTRKAVESYARIRALLRRAGA